MTFGTWIGEVVSLTHRPPLPPGNVPCTHFHQGLSGPQGHGRVGRNMSLKNPVTPGGIDPGTIQLVAQHLSHYATPSPNRNEYQEYCLGAKGGQCVGLTTLLPSCAVLKFGSLNLLEPSGPVQAWNGIDLPFTVTSSHTYSLSWAMQKGVGGNHNSWASQHLLSFIRLLWGKDGIDLVSWLYVVRKHLPTTYCCSNLGVQKLSLC